MATEPLLHDSTLSDEHSLDSSASSLSSHASNGVLESTNEHHRLLSPTVPSADTVVKDQVGSPVATPTGTSLPIPDDGKPKLLPVPATPVNHLSSSQTSFFIPGSGDNVGVGEPEGLLPEIAKADVSIAGARPFTVWVIIW